jgi:hypothetical protein
VSEKKVIEELPEVEVSIARPETAVVHAIPKAREPMPAGTRTAVPTRQAVSGLDWIDAAGTDEVRVQRWGTTGRTPRKTVTTIMI